MFLIIILSILIGSCQTSRVGKSIISPTCPPTKVLKNGKLNSLDKWTLQNAKKECPKRYNGRSPCVVYFKKTGFNSYIVLCGAKK